VDNPSDFKISCRPYPVFQRLFKKVIFTYSLVMVKVGSAFEFAVSFVQISVL
jgi:hypothetical protein